MPKCNFHSEETATHQSTHDSKIFYCFKCATYKVKEFGADAVKRLKEDERV